MAQNVLGLPDDTPNPHLWYDPKTMPAVARVMATDLERTAARPPCLLPDHGWPPSTASLQPWLAAIAAFQADHGGTPVAVTEPVADYLLQAMGADIVTPFTFQADIMNGVDPSPEAITQERSPVHRPCGQGVLLQPAGGRTR